MAAPHPVIELRQYKIVAGKRDALIDLFEREFVESQEAVGNRLVGQFRDLDDPNRFTWIRAFEDMDHRAKALTDFYFGPVWQAHRAEANPLLDDNDNVLLLQPAQPGSGFGPAQGARVAPDAKAPPAGLVIATIHYLWKDPNEGFSAFFRDQLTPALAAAGVPVIASYVPETQPNNFPRLPVRQGEKVFVWFTRVPDQVAWDRARAALSVPKLADFEERAPQILRLSPTRRSLLR
jgi:quinol monooxygenase YgiN